MDVDDSKPGLPNPSAISWLFLKTIYFSNLVHVTAWNAILTPQSIWWILAPLLAQTVKNLPPMRETWVWSLGPEDSLEKGMATHSSILAWEIPWTEEFGGLQSMGLQRVRHNWVTNTHSLRLPLGKSYCPWEFHLRLRFSQQTFLWVCFIV